MSDPVVLKERRGPALWLTINRPEQRNAITDEVIGGIHAGLNEAEANPQIRVVVLTALFRGPAGIKITQRDIFQPVRRVVRLQRTLDHKFRPAVRVDGMLRMFFIDRDILRVAVRGAG